MRIWSLRDRRRWVVYGLLGVVFLLVNLYRLSSAVLSDRFMIAFETTGAALGTLHAAFFYIYAVVQLPAGVLADRAGPRVTVTVGAVVFNAGAIGFALADTYTTAFLFRALIGLGGGVIFISVLRYCASWFRPTEFATMNGLTVAIAGLGGIMAATPLAVAADTFGWRQTMLALGGFGLVVAAVVFVLADDSPDDAGFESIGAADGDSVTMAEVYRNLGIVLGERETWVMGLMMFCAVGVLITLLGLWGVPFVVQVYDVSVTAASWYTLLGSVGFLVGPPIFGWVSDRLERRVVLITGGAGVSVVGFGTLAFVGQPPLFVVGIVYFVAGFMMGGYALSYAVIKERHPTSASGVSTSTINGAGFLGAALFPTMMGYALDVYWTGDTVAGARIYTEFGYQVSFGIATLAALVAFLCSVWLYRNTPSA
ncbi:MAG: MFS transporter [Natronomonas sp.]